MKQVKISLALVSNVGMQTSHLKLLKHSKYYNCYAQFVVEQFGQQLEYEVVNKLILHLTFHVK